MPKPLVYRVQNHAARRLHHDFRLEIGVALKGWAITRGSSLVAGEHRLNVAVEDLVLDYIDFEGVIAMGYHGAVLMLLWDRATGEPDGDCAAALATGSAALTLQGEKLIGRWRLERMKSRLCEEHVSWLLVKSHDAARERGDLDILEEQPRSVLTGRTVKDIAATAA
ncbi:DNA polymerase ligase N-terminal domain-containing protein [Methylobacterium sp. J-077]|uniref:DNA polymerase ligase N-terminal domain-containing protein n=1 Tax=Methylobacterium sp. J-077 TaxID=2836656 RepID=UPI001FBBE171|nr:DNA polymerase ligase N-terminal domain-containing protein [Methylobacterium sp. J-077]MCJ2124005.1 hypothetical protein [Methylobacterium sp. J-077]